MTRVLLGLLAILFSSAPLCAQNYGWYRFTESDTVFVFIHGMLSNSQDGWKNKNGTYWPDLIQIDQRFVASSKEGKKEEPSIFLAGFTTSLHSVNYGIDDAAIELLTNLRNQTPDLKPRALTKEKFIFVAHSTGGIVLRKMLSSKEGRESFSPKKIGLVLIASPSHGSYWADKAEFAARILNHEMIKQLMRSSAILAAVNLQWTQMLTAKTLPFLEGVEAFESTSIAPGLPSIVDMATQSPSFASPRRIPESDHFTIAKPDNAYHPSHAMLLDFYTQRFLPAITIASEKNNRDNIVESKSRPTAVTPMEVATQPTQPEPPSQAQARRKRIESLVTAFVTGWNAGNLASVPFGDRVTFFDMGLISSGEALKDAQRFFNEFTKRNYRSADVGGGLDIVIKNVGANKVDVTHPFTYHAAGRTRTLDGTAKYIFNLEEMKGTFRIIGVDIIDRKQLVTYNRTK
jgi:hypothetical protein